MLLINTKVAILGFRGPVLPMPRVRVSERYIRIFFVTGTMHNGIAGTGRIIVGVWFFLPQLTSTPTRWRRETINVATYSIFYIVD